jgi:hypothetical protein
MPAKSLMHCVGIIPKIPTVCISTLPPVQLSKSRLHIAQAVEGRRLTNGPSHIWGPSSLALKHCIHNMTYSSPYFPLISERPSSPTPSEPAIEPGSISDDEWNLRAGEWPSIQI